MWYFPVLAGKFESVFIKHTVSASFTLMFFIVTLSLSRGLRCLQGLDTTGWHETSYNRYCVGFF
jgi:hypothetical protein